MTNLEIFDSLKKGDKLNITFGDAINKSNQKKLIVSSKNTVGKGKSWESEKVTFTNLENPTGVKFFAYKRKNGNVSFAIGDMAISNVKIELENKMAEGGVVRKMYSGDAVLYEGNVWYVTEKDGKLGITNLKSGAWGSKYPFVERSRIDTSKLTDMMGRKVELVESKMAKGGSVGSSFEYTIGGL